MLRFVTRRLLLMVPTLLGITLVTFLLLDLAPMDRAEIALAKERAQTVMTDAESRELALLRLQIRYGLIDAATHEPLSVWQRYGRWLGRAARLDLAGPGEDSDSFNDRIRSALPVTLLISFWALGLAVAVGIPLGARLGLRAGTREDRTVSGLLFLAGGVPEFLAATLLILTFGGVWLDWFPSMGLRSDTVGLSRLEQLLDLAWHLCLPVLTLALAPCVMITRFLRESVSRSMQTPFVLNLQAWGVPQRTVARRAVHNGLSPLATLAGSLLPLLVGGSVVVESVFTLDGLGLLAYRAALGQDQGMVMALTLLSAVVTLIGLLLSDLLHRAIDPRVRLT